MGEEWVPRFPDTHPPFEQGNDLATVHGAYSPRKVEPLTRELVELMLTDPALRYLQAAAYRPALWAWARAESQVQLLTEWLAGQGEKSGDGVGDLGNERVKSAYLLLHRAEARALSGRRALGLDPLARARLGKDVAQGRAADVDVALRMAQLAELERQGWTPPPAGDGAAGGASS